MHILKKLIIFPTLLLSFGLHAVMGEYPVEFGKHVENLADIAAVLEKALALDSEFARRDLRPSYLFDMTSAQINQAAHATITQKLPAIKARFACAVKHELNQEQREIVIRILTDLKKLSATSTEDLVSIGNILYNKDLRDACLAAFQKYIPAHLSVFPLAIDPSELSPHESLTIMRELEKIDVHNHSCNVMKNFVSVYIYDNDINCIVSSTKPCSLTNDFCGYVQTIIGTPAEIFLGIHPSTYKIDFRKLGALFEVIHTVSSQLLEAITE